MTQSVVFEDTNSDLHSNIPSILANKNPHDSSSISLLTTQLDSIHQNQVIKYNNNLSFQDLLEEAKNVHNNHISESTCLQLKYFKYHATISVRIIIAIKNIFYKL